MTKYQQAEIVELGSASLLVLGGEDEPPDNISGTSQRQMSYEAADVVELGDAREIVLGGDDEPADNISLTSLKQVALNDGE